MQDRPIKDLPAISAADRMQVVPTRRVAGRLWQAVLGLWRRRWWAVTTLAAALLLWKVVLPAMLGPLVTVDQAIRTDFVQSVVASGHVEAPFRVNVGAQITGVVVEVPVSEGQTVKAGDVLVRLDDREARAAVVQAEGVAAQAEARMRQLREFTLPSAQETLRQAKATLVNAESAYDRTALLAKGGISSRASLEDALRARDIARAQVRSAELQVYTNSPGGSDYVMAETLLNQANATLSTAQSRLSYTVITAPRDGLLISRNVERGNVVQPAMVLMLLSPAVETQLVVQIDEKNIGLIALGQKALASADAYPGEQFPAEIAYVNPGVDMQRASVQVKLRVPNPPSYLRQDMTVSIDIETNRRPGAVVLPAASVRGAGTPNPWVMVLQGGRATKRAIKIGLTGGGKAEIVKGLADGDTVIPPTVTSVKEGARVRPAPRHGGNA